MKRVFSLRRRAPRRTPCAKGGPLKRALAACALLVASAACEAGVVVVTLLGAGGPPPEIERFGPATLIEAGGRRLLFDAGRGVAQRLRELRTPLAEIDALFVTHLHYDHLVGLPDLLMSGWVFRREHPLVLRGPAGTERHARALEEAYRADIGWRVEHARLPVGGARFDARDIKPGVAYERDGVTVTAFAVDHGVVKPAFGYRIDFGGRVVVLSGDTRYSPELVRRAKGADLLLHEVADAAPRLLADNPRLRKVLAYHTSPADLARVLSETRPRLAVMVHALHFGLPREALVERVRAAYDGEVELGEDLMAFDVGERLRLYRRPAW